MSMLYELCPLCEGKGVIGGMAFRECTCKPLRVVETGLTSAQAEAAVRRAQAYEDALRAVTGAMSKTAEVRLSMAMDAVREALRTKGGTRG